MEGDASEVSDVYGNNAAILCPSCKKAFVFSGFLNKKAGRVCPHCGAAKAILCDGRIKVELANTGAG